MNTNNKLPAPRICRREVNPEIERQAIAAGLHPVAARVIAGRPVTGDNILEAISPGLGQLDHYRGLADIEKAAKRIARAILDGEVIGIETDHDVDGVTSHAIIKSALLYHFRVPADQIQGYIGHRLKDGYGLSEAIANRMLAADPRPAVVITADNGSSDEARIARLAAEGIDVIVTDHHEVPAAGLPASAYACITPHHPENQYPDRCIAGCMVAWLTMCAVRNELLASDEWNAEIPPLGSLLDYVAVGTVADCVSLARSRNNRAVVTAGLKIINKMDRPCWRAIKVAMRRTGELTAQDLAFGIGPRINARGRLDEAMAGVEFLMALDDSVAEVYAELLEEENEERKRVERKLKEDAMLIALEQVNAGASGIVVWLPDGHSGVHGIVASRVVEAFGRPVVCISPRFGSDEVVTGSARGIPGFHVQQALQACADRLPEIFRAFGGHEGAGGLTIDKNGIDAFRQMFDQVAKEQLTGRELGPIIWTDGEVSPEFLGLGAVDALAELDPYGREFESPLFEGRFHAAAIKPVGDGTHLKVGLAIGGKLIDAIWFRARESAEDPMPIAEGQLIRVVYTINANEFRGNRQAQLVIEHVAIEAAPSQRVAI